MNSNICVFCSSSDTVDQEFVEVANNLGREIALNKDVLIFGGGTTGLMGACARSVHRSEGKVVGVIPKGLNVSGVVYEKCDEIYETKDLRERKGIMDSMADVFIALPGGFGTIEEIMEIITLKQLKYHNKPIVLINKGGFFNHLIRQFDYIIQGNFACEECKNLYYITESICQAFAYIRKYRPLLVDAKNCEKQLKKSC